MIRTKVEMYRRWHAGQLGNTPRVWANIEQLMASGFKGEVTIRTAEKAGGITIYGVPWYLVPLRAAPLAKPVFNESMPDDDLLLQGEVMQGETGLVLAYSRTPGLKMNVARRGFITAEGLHARMVLRQALWPNDYEDLMDLLDQYPGHVVEFATYDWAVGRLPNRNTVIFEVRAY